MGRIGVATTLVLLAIAAKVYGRPASNEASIQIRQEIMLVRQESEQTRQTRPCYSRFLEVQADILQYEKIKGGPNYVPECDSSGIKWMASQCDHVGEGTCFCVHEDDGNIIEHTKDLRLNKEALACGGRKALSDYPGQECFHMRYEFNRTQEEYGLESQSPLQYYPDCNENGMFTALQRNDRSQFFCVDTKNGRIIPETVTDAFAIPPLSEHICRAYDQVWQDFKEWNSTWIEPEIDENSCSAGLLFTKCGCPKKCTHRSDYDFLHEDCACKPACVCPVGKLELDGKCVTLEECHEAKPSSGTLQDDKLDALTNGDYSRWKEYRRNNPNAVLISYNSIERQEARLFSASGPVAHDTNPNNRMLYFEPPREEEGSQEENENNNFGPYGAEPIPIWGQNRPILRQVLEEDGPEEEEVEKYQQGNIYGPVEPEQNNGREPIPVEGEGEEYHEEEYEFTEWNEEEEQNHENVEENASEPEEEEEEEENETKFESESEEFEETEELISYGEDNIYPEEEEVEEEEYIKDNIQPEYEEEDNSFHEEERPQNFEETENAQGETETENEDHFEETGNVEEQESIEEFLPEDENRYFFEETQNIQGQEPVEENNEDSQGNIRFLEDESRDNQNEFTSVPQPEHDAMHDHQATPPCEDEVNATEESSTENEEDLAVVDRVLIENGIIPPKPIEATLEKPSPSIKKNING